jgi:hypothetical protein
MGAALWLFILLFFVPTVLYGLGVEPLIAVYLFALNLVAGYFFWLGKPLGGLGQKSVALAYMTSGMFFFAFLVEPVRIDTAPIERLNTAAAWRETLRLKPEPTPQLVGTPLDMTEVDRRRGVAARPWLEGFVEDVVRRPEEPR